MISLINLFFVPMITLYIYYARRKEKLTLSFPFLVKYCITAVLVFLFAKLLSQFVNIFYPIALPTDRAPYTLFAVPVAVALPLLIEFVQKYFHLNIKIESKNDAHEAE